MKTNWMTVEKEILTRRAFAFLVLVAIIILVTPLLYIAPFNHMSADDYWFGYLPHDAWRNTHSLYQVFLTALITVRNIYQTWQGTFTSIFFFAITPGVFGEQYYFIVPYMIIGMTFLSTFLFFHAVLRKCLGFDFYTWFSASGIVSLMQIEFIDAGTAGLYWYNGSVHYMFMQGFAISAISFSILFVYGAFHGSKKVPQVLRLIFAGICSFMASGANFSTALLNVELLFILLAFCVYLFVKTRKKSLFLAAIPFAIGTVGLIFNMAAPGNAVRQAMFPKTSAPIAVLLSFANSARKLLEWTDIYVIMILLILLPFLLKAVSRSKYDFRHPELVIALLFCLYTSMFTPAQYSMSSLPIDRNLNICQTFYYMTLILSEAYLLGFLEKKVSFIRKAVPAHGKKLSLWALLPIASFLIMVIVFSASNQGQKRMLSTSYIAWCNIEDGSGKTLRNEYWERLDQYRENPDPVVYVKPYSVKPALLFVNSDTEYGVGEDRMISNGVAYWYGKAGIYEVDSPDEFEE